MSACRLISLQQFAERVRRRPLGPAHEAIQRRSRIDRRFPLQQDIAAIEVATPSWRPIQRERVAALVAELDARRAEAGDDVEVLELFWYGCPHCYQLEPHIERWLETKPERPTSRRLPAVVSPRWIPHAKAYFAAVDAVKRHSALEVPMLLRNASTAPCSYTHLASPTNA